jgi:hypothetical protein
LERNSSGDITTWHKDRWGNNLPGIISYPTAAEKLSDSAMWADACG